MTFDFPQGPRRHPHLSRRFHLQRYLLTPASEGLEIFLQGMSGEERSIGREGKGEMEVEEREMCVNTAKMVGCSLRWGVRRHGAIWVSVVAGRRGWVLCGGSPLPRKTSIPSFTLQTNVFCVTSLFSARSPLCSGLGSK